MSRRVAAGIVLAVLVLGGPALAAAWVGAAGHVRVDIEIRHSRFSPAAVAVPRGRPIVFVVRNDDPIDHEWIVGDERVHDRHRTGTEPSHDERATEVSIEALSSRKTTVTFEQTGTFRFVCHLPGHEAYGMVGVVTVR
jgi:uncharacterized cupredoxin-like copper-binding protein